MAIINLEFNHELNVSVQIGDIVYYIDTNPVGPNRQWASTTTPHMTADREDIIMIGPVVNIIPWNGTFSQIDVFWNPNPIFSPLPPSGSFIMFSKDNKANLSSALGYYAELKLENNSLDESELFAVNTGVFESSK